MANGLLGGLSGLGPLLGLDAPVPVLGNAAIAEQAPLKRQTNFLEAVKQLGLTKEEQNLYQHHLMNMAAGAQVRGPEGTSSILQINVQGPDGRFYDMPTVWGGKILSPDEGKKKAIATHGWDYWPSYDTSDEADARYMQYHEYMARDMPHQGWDALYGEDQ
jgi:hypothetical protein